MIISVHKVNYLLYQAKIFSLKCNKKKTKKKSLACKVMSAFSFLFLSEKSEENTNISMWSMEL